MSFKIYPWRSLLEKENLNVWEYFHSIPAFEYLIVILSSYNQDIDTNTAQYLNFNQCNEKRRREIPKKNFLATNVSHSCHSVTHVSSLDKGSQSLQVRDQPFVFLMNNTNFKWLIFFRKHQNKKLVIFTFTDVCFHIFNEVRVLDKV